MIFYTGIPKYRWLERVRFPVFVSRTILPVRSFPRATCRWALDSGEFTQIDRCGSWDDVTPAAWVRIARQASAEIGGPHGGPDFVAIQDWMCEPQMLEKTGLTVLEHQRRTVENYLRLREMAPEMPWLPTLQGWERDDYLRCADMYYKAGVALDACDRVGIGSVCRRQHTEMAEALILELASGGLKIHGFGFKLQGLEKVKHVIRSSDSMAWSTEARWMNHKGKWPNATNDVFFCAWWRRKFLLPKVEAYLDRNHEEDPVWSQAFLNEFGSGKWSPCSLAGWIQLYSRMS
jgi:hypothetical protein